MLHCLDDVAGTSFTLCADHSGALGDAAEGLTEVAATADKGGLEIVFCDVVEVIGGGKDFRLINVVDANGFEDLSHSRLVDVAEVN
jgi:hypothetical protein